MQANPFLRICVLLQRLAQARIGSSGRRAGWHHPEEDPIPPESATVNHHAVMAIAAGKA